MQTWLESQAWGTRGRDRVAGGWTQIAEPSEEGRGRLGRGAEAGL